jgi:hypothetical protein
MNKLIHYCTIIYLALIILIRMMAMPISLVEYSLNKDFIAANLCENRLKSEVHCAGSCYLGKQLAKAGENQNSREQKGSFKILINDFFESINQPLFGCSQLTAAHQTSMNTRRMTNHFRAHLFRPPIA